MSLGDPIFKNRLLLAKYLFEILGEENTRMQAKYAMFTVLWDRVCLLETKLTNCQDHFLNDDFSLVGVSSLTLAEKECFTATIKAVLSGINTRFPCPSTSLNKRRLGKTDDNGYTLSEPRILERTYISCPLSVLYDVYVFPGSS